MDGSDGPEYQAVVEAPIPVLWLRSLRVSLSTPM